MMSAEATIQYDEFENYVFTNIATYSRGQWVKGVARAALNIPLSPAEVS